MGYEIDEIESIELFNKETGEKIGAIKNVKEVQFEYSEAASLKRPPLPNIKMIISPGTKDGMAITALCFYRPKYYNWFQRLMYRVCFGIIIKQGAEVRHDYLKENY